MLPNKPSNKKEPAVRRAPQLPQAHSHGIKIATTSSSAADKAAATARTLANLERRLSQVRLIGYFQAASSFATIFLGLALGLVVDGQASNGWVPTALLILSLVTCLIYLAAAFIARPSPVPVPTSINNNSKPSAVPITLVELHLLRYVVASSMVVGTALVAITTATALVGSATPMAAFFLIIPALAGIFEFSRWAVFTSALLAGLSLSVLITIEQVFKLHHAPLPVAEYPAVSFFLWLLALSVITVSVMSFTSRFARANNNLQERTSELGVTVGNLENVLAFLAQLSAQVNSATSELTATASQQAGSAQEQAAAVGQVSTSMEELGETATQIAHSAQGAAAAAGQMVAIARQVEEQSQQATERAEEGNAAIEAATGDLAKVRNRIDTLSQRLVALTEQAQRVVITLAQIDEIADETHLLALNAGIEAAGEIFAGSGEDASAAAPLDNSNKNAAGQMRRPDPTTSLAGGERSSLRGHRFRIVAQEIKSLADRSREFTTEIKQSLTEMQGTLAAAVLVAEEGRKAMEAALIRSQVAGAVINRLSGAVTESSEQYSQVITASQLVQQRAEEISLATNQQRTANLQIVQTIRDLAELARQGAAAVAQISQTVSGLNNQTGELSGLLTQAGLSAAFSHSSQDSGSAAGQSQPPTATTNLHQFSI